MPGNTDRKISRDILQVARQESRRRKMYPLLSRFYLVVVIVALLDFILLFAVSSYIGGDAVNGKIENGKYYVWGYRYQDRVKGFTEVSRSFFDFSKWQVYSV